MKSGDNTIIFIFNTSDEDKAFNLGKEIISLGADAENNGGKMLVRAGCVGYAVI